MLGGSGLRNKSKKDAIKRQTSIQINQGRVTKGSVEKENCGKEKLASEGIQSKDGRDLVPPSKSTDPSFGMEPTDRFKWLNPITRLTHNGYAHHFLPNPCFEYNLVFYPKSVILASTLSIDSFFLCLLRVLSSPT